MDAKELHPANSPHLHVDEARMFDAKLEGNYDLHDEAHSPPYAAGRKEYFERPPSSGGNRGGRLLGSRLQPSVTISDNSSEVFCAQFSPDGKLLAAGCADGAIRIFSVSTGKLAYNLQTGTSVSLPTTSLRFRPAIAQTKTRNVLVSVNASGAIQHWHITSGKCLSTIEEEDQFYALDYRPDGGVFAAAGKDKTIRIYDETTKHEVMQLQGGTGYGTSSAPGHSNRVFSIKFHPRDPEIVLTGGWDNTVQFWDMRVRHSVRSIYGPHISGDALDLCEDEVLTGSWRPENALEVWDYGSGELISSIPWSSRTGGASQPAQPTLLYAAQFSSRADGGRYIAAGGSGANEAKVFDHAGGDRLVGTITGLSRGVFTLDFSPADEAKKLAVAGGDASIRIIDIVEEHVDDDVY